MWHSTAKLKGAASATSFQDRYYVADVSLSSLIAGIAPYVYFESHIVCDGKTAHYTMHVCDGNGG